MQRSIINCNRILELWVSKKVLHNRKKNCKIVYKNVKKCKESVEKDKRM